MTVTLPAPGETNWGAKLNQAVTDADNAATNAQSTADSATTAASNAQSTADSASSSASSLRTDLTTTQGDVSTLQTDMSTAQGDISTLQTDMSTAQGDITALQNAPDGTPAASSAAARDSYWGAPTAAADQITLQNKGALTIRTDKGWTEQYFAAYDASTNPQGMMSAGWYPIAGKLPSVRFKRVAGGSVGTSIATIPFDTLADGSLVGLTVSGGIFTCQQPGAWQITGAVTFATGSTSVNVNVRQNGVAKFGSSVAATTVSYTTAVAAGTLFLGAGDTFDIAAFAGASIGFIPANGGIPTVFVEAKYLGPA